MTNKPNEEEPLGEENEAQIIHLIPEDQRAFVELLLNPPPLTPAMERAIGNHRRLILGIE